MHIHHMGYIVKKINKAIEAFLELGFDRETDIIFDDYRGVDICFLVKDGYRVELVSPKSRESVVYELQKKFGNSPYHICYECADLESAIIDLRGRGYVPTTEQAREAVALANHKVCFFVHPYLGMIELLEEDK